MSEQRVTAIDGDDRRRGELRDAVDLIRGSGGNVVFETLPGALHEELPPDRPADGVGASQAPAAPDAAAALSRALIDAADALAETLAQLDATAWRAHPLRSAPAAP